jgi:hypothetical protein
MTTTAKFMSIATMLLLGHFAIDAQTYFTANLTSSQENPAVESEALGTGVFILDEEGLHFSVTVNGLDMTAAHFHRAATGTNGGVVRAITDDFEGNTATGTWRSTDDQALTEDLIQDLLLGNIYVNVHTAANSPGEIRGQVNLSSGTSFSASLTGVRENPPVETEAAGTGAFTLTDAGLVFAVTVENVEFTAAHFHNGSTGVNGGVVRAITDDFVGNTAYGVWTADDDQPLTDELITDLLLGNIYVNVHSADNPSGEIRGQLEVNSGTGFHADLSGEQEVPAVETEAKGTGTFTLTDEGLIFGITVEGLEMTAAHFHLAAAGSNGGVVRAITEDFTGNTAMGVWRGNDNQPLTKELIAELIRGQVVHSPGLSFTARIDGAQITSDVVTEGSGFGRFSLTSDGLVFGLTVHGLEPAAIQFHQGSVGMDGPFVREITMELDGNTARGLWSPEDQEPLTSELINDLLAGNIYVNIRTEDNPGGEIRGQLISSSGTAFSANLRGAQENPSAESEGSGTGFFTLLDSSLLFSITYTGVDMTAAHFHNATAGLNGGVVRDIGPDFTGQTAWGLWTPGDDQPFTPAMLNELIAGNLYVNVHSAANPGGEIRGQVLLSGGTGFAARIEGAQEVPPVETNASGTGAFTLTNAGLAFSITADGLDFTAAHFHNAGPGTNGGVVRGITDEFGETTTAWGLWSPSDAQALTAEQRGDLIEGNIYVNLHTAENPGGEIRGQLGRPQFSTSVHYLGERNEAEGLTLYQNYPNPFTEGTQIAFSIDKAGPVSIKIFNSFGQEVQSIVRVLTGAGFHTVPVKSSGLAPGIYYYTLDFGPTRLTGKMSIIK